MADYTLLKAKTADIVPAINDKPLHSLVDPKKEAERLVATIPEDCGFVIFLGLGGGFAPLAAAEKTQVTVIDFNVSQLISLNDYSAINILHNPATEEIKNFILTHYKPALHGGIKVIPLKTRCDHDTQLFESAAESIQQAVDIVSSDFSVQAHFGKRWFCNIIRNIKNACSLNDGFLKLFPDTERAPRKIAIAAAGPSLDRQIPLLADCKKQGCFIISSDTALGALFHHGITPDVIVSIDCQHISYYHFIGKNIKDIPLVLDIASPPLLGDRSRAPVYFASGHPLAQYASENWCGLPRLDTSGGNVTYACVSLAETLGAETITLFGADFAYLCAQTYARGTYVYPFFEKKQNRFAPIETQCSAFLYRSPFLPAEPGQQYRETSSLRFYRQRLEEKTGVSIVPASGVPVQIKKNSHRITRINTNEDNKSTIEFMIDYRDKIKNSNDQNIITTLLPYASFLKHRNPKIKTHELLEKTKLACIAEIDKIL